MMLSLRWGPEDVSKEWLFHSYLELNLYYFNHNFSLSGCFHIKIFASSLKHKYSSADIYKRFHWVSQPH